MLIHADASLGSAAVTRLPSDGFKGTRVLIVGDVMLDRYISGEVTRISPEAPVPVLSVGQERRVAGGAANVALNVAGLGAETVIAGVTGDDDNGVHLRAILGDAGVAVDGLLADSERKTTCKTRVIAGNQQIVRLDDESVHELSEAAASELMHRITDLLNVPTDVVILSDYAKGTLSVDLTERIIATCAARKVPLFVDPKRPHYGPYAGALCITPNWKEFHTALTGMSIQAEHWVLAAQSLRRRLRCNSLLVTQGADGMTLVTAKHIYHFAALAEEVFDVSGAGDTVIATLATAVGSGLDFITAVQLSNIAASLVVRRAGTSPIVWSELQHLIKAEAAQYSDERRQLSSPSLGRAAVN